ncbi:concanavalin A-like lectin/glucanase domain-containing protein [Sordaria brevicollis]|uniref:Crh-like protein n=1 Tax=Sordaria brevicollis TaxID=83679 RepID=A0AAE0PDL4_SORBR|nr:concanavalin A-like lectin/glucanase domain-containing protein [Sordaria brevicollis]
MVSLSWRTAVTAAFASVASAQTWSACNPTQRTDCPPNTALGMSIAVDFTQGGVNSFNAYGGNPSYSRDGVSFTVSKSGDSPQLASLFYIMFGRVEITMKAAPGAGIVSSVVLQSDTLDEIDFEWLGADNTYVQTNFFSQGKTASYDRGQFNPAPNSQGQFIKYTIDWTSERIAWYVGGTLVRSLTVNEAGGQYPQSPMQVKFGAWSGGDSANPPGTIQWARGPTDYSKGPFSMVVKSVMVADYSTGKSYRYGDTSGTWQSIIAEGGKINGNLGKAGTVTVTASAPAATNTAEGSVPVGGIGAVSGDASGSNGGSGSTGGTTTHGSIPDGWVMKPDGKIVPVGAASGTMRPSQSLLVATSLVAVALAAFVGCLA